MHCPSNTASSRRPAHSSLLPLLPLLLVSVLSSSSCSAATASAISSSSSARSSSSFSSSGSGSGSSSAAGDGLVAGLAGSSLSLSELYFSNRTLLNNFLYPTATVTADAPYIVRYLLLQVVAAYDVVALCTSAVALPFLGTRVAGPPVKFCRSRDGLAELILQTTYHLLAVDLPVEASSLSPFLRHFGLLGDHDEGDDGDDDSGDSSSSESLQWAVTHARRLAKYFATDGWNSRTTPPFADNTGFAPVNAPGTSARRLRRPLRWTPGVSYDLRGRYVAQVAVFPYLGMHGHARPLVLSEKDYWHGSRRTRAPFRRPWSHNRVDGEATDGRNALFTADSDADLATKLANETRSLSDGFGVSDDERKKRHALARWWDSKLASTGAMTLHYARALPLQGPLDFLALLLGDMLAQHDAILLAFREKRRHDLTRPQQLVRRMLLGSAARTWQSSVPAQPHSEFPSASAALCEASMAHVRTFGDAAMLRNGTLKGSGWFPVFRGRVQRSTFNPKGPEDDGFEVRFETPEEAARQCGESRLWAGVHFRPAIEEGRRITLGVGERAFEHVRDLVNGRRPRACWRCGRYWLTDIGFCFWCVCVCVWVSELG